MDQRLNFVTLAVDDVGRSKAFYVDGLGWEATFEAADEVLFIQVAHGVMLSLWNREQFIDEVGYAPARGQAPITLAHNVSSPDEVDAVLADARAAGAVDSSDGTHRDWGGYSGYFADPDGFRWEVAHNPLPDGVALVAQSKDWLARHRPGSAPH